MRRVLRICIWIGVVLALGTGSVILYVKQSRQGTRMHSTHPQEQSLPNTPKAAPSAGRDKIARQNTFQKGADLRFESILTNKNRIPNRAILRSLTLNDEEALLGEYQRTPTTDLRSLTWALAAAGGDAAAAVLQRSLTEGRGDLEIDSEEFGILHNHLLALGFISARSDLAYRFLTEATQADYWGRHRAWRHAEPEVEAAMNIRLASLAISSLGLSGRDDVESQLENLKSQPLPIVREIRSGLLDGAFYAELTTKIGHQSSLELWGPSLSAMLGRYADWQEHSSKGREWKKWSDELIRAAAPSSSAKNNHP